MPYIPSDRRDELNRCCRVRVPENVGELNYFITRALLDYLQSKGLSYQTINDIRGALGCAADEFYRRVAVPYEQKKIEENGDVY